MVEWRLPLPRRPRGSAEATSVRGTIATPNKKAPELDSWQTMAAVNDTDGAAPSLTVSMRDASKEIHDTSDRLVNLTSSVSC